MAALLASCRCTKPIFSLRNVITRRQIQTQLKQLCTRAAVCERATSRERQPLFKSNKWTRSHSFSRVSQFHTSSFCSQLVTVKTPPFADSVTEGDIRWEKAVGDFVEEDEVIGEIETDKTTMEVKAPTAGIIEAILVPEGTVTPGQELLTIKPGAEGAPAETEAAAPAPPAPEPAAPAPAATPPPPAATPPPPPAPTPPPPPPAQGEWPPQMPAQVPPLPTGPMASKPAASVTPVVAPPAVASDTGPRSEKRVKMSRMRLRIAQRLKDAQNTCAMLTTFNEVDMSNVVELRKTYKDAFFKKHGIKLGFMSAFVKAAAVALQNSPEVNAVIDDQEIVYRDYVDISVAVATPKGLVVPVLRGVESMNYADIEKGLNELGEKAKSGNLAVEDMDGGTFTISNGGVFGSMFGTPIINPPQSAILGMHAIFERPVAINGKIEIRPMMYVALTYDHRLIDGREGVTFLRKIKAAVEDPRSLFLDL